MYWPTMARTILQWLALCVGLLLPVAHAAFPATSIPENKPGGVCYNAPCHEWSNTIDVSWQRTPQSAANLVIGKSHADCPNVLSVSLSGSYPNYSYSAVCNFGPGNTPTRGPYGLSVRTRTADLPEYSCPANATLGGSSCTCNTGYEESGSSCVIVSLCDVGKARTVNVTTGWARSSRPDTGDVAIDYGLPPLHDYNDGVCVGNISSVDSCFRSQEPAANGLYRLSCDFTMVMTGDAMSSGDVNADALNPVPACPGFLGEINGKPACVGTASSPLPSSPLPSGAPSPQPGNPTAGEKPTTGEGSGSTGAGRTPVSGSGGNTGGPASAAVRPGWSSPSPGDDTGQPCGGPGQPVCSVKVDETGTPSAASADGYFNDPSSGLDAQRGILDGLLGDIADWDIGSWTWTFQLPTGCTPLEMYEGVVVNPCLWLDQFHSIMSFVWVLTGICGLFVIYSRAF